ncbi:MAG: hypothetical protein A2X47_06880 [Lentisphaerae bacterium GWF2_38_69]|nr:MAG: hypothetical protein A2X47_06880 [Lentisphaerae bacterium GWF2_38_69]
MNIQISIGGQKAFIHRKSFEYGYFHTYENLTLKGDSRKIHVFLPSDYENSKRKYPVVYMNDGQTAFHCGGLSPWSWDVDSTLEELSKKGEIEKVIIVAVYPVDRSREYLPKKNYLAESMGLKEGNLDIYGNYIANTLKPFIDKYYAVDSNPAKTSIVGASFGGVVAFYIPAIYPDKIGIGAVMSPSLSSVINFDEDGIPEVNTQYLKEIEKAFKTAKIKPSYWIDWGGQEGDIAECCPLLIKRLEEKFGYKENKNLFFMNDTFATHDERAWKYRFGIFLKTFYGKNKK